MNNCFEIQGPCENLKSQIFSPNFYTFMSLQYVFISGMMFVAKQRSIKFTAGCKTRFFCYNTYLPLHSRRIYYKWPKFIYLWYFLCFKSSWSHLDYSIKQNIYTCNAFTLSYPKYSTLYRGFPHYNFDLSIKLPNFLKYVIMAQPIMFSSILSLLMYSHLSCYVA